MASQGGWVVSQEKFGWVCTAFEPLPCLKIIYFTTLLKAIKGSFPLALYK